MSSTTSAPSPPPPSSGSSEAPPSAPDRRCLNCGEPLTGRYCSACGQKEVEPDPRLRELAHEAADELLHWDGKLVTTLAALFRRPGLLTAEYLAGRRARYVSPLRLYLTASVVYFAVIALIPETSTVRFSFDAKGDSAAVRQVASSPPPAADSSRTDSARAGDDAYRATKRGVFARIARDPERFRVAFMHNRPKAMFVLLPLFALALRGLYRKRGRYPAHFIFALHLHAFAFLVLAAASASAALAEPLDALEPIGVLAIAVYLALALRRGHGEGWGRTLAKTGALAVVYLFAFAFTIVGLLALTALTYS